MTLAPRAPRLPVERLTPREWDVIRAVATGRPYKAIAPALGLSDETFKRHIFNIYLKLDVTNAIEMLIAVGILQVPS